MHDEAASQRQSIAANQKLLNVEKLIAGCESVQARKGELLLRCGEEPRSVLVILSGGVRVSSQADNTVESKPRAASANVGYLEPGDWLGALLCLKRARSQFSFVAATPQGLVAKVIPAEFFRDKVCPLMPRSYWDDEADTEAQWAEAADDAKRAAATRRQENIAEERRGNFAKRQHYHIPDKLRVRCCPDLSASAAATRRQDPPPPKVEPTLQETQRELRQERIKGPQEAEAESDSSSDSEMLLSPDRSGNVRGGKRGAFEGLGLVALLHLQDHAEKEKKKQPQAEVKAKAKPKGKPKAKSGAGQKFLHWKPIFYPRRLPLDKWQESREYEVLQHVPVLLPDMFNTDDVLSEKDMLARKRKALVMSVIRQIRISLKSGVREVNGMLVNDAASLFHALDRDGSGSLDTTELAAGLARFMPGISQSDMEEVIKAIDTDGDQLIDIAELVGAIEQPKTLFRESPTPSKAPSGNVSLTRSLRSSVSYQDVAEAAQEVFDGLTMLREYNEGNDFYSVGRPKSACWTYELETKEPVAVQQKVLPGRQRPRSSNANSSSRQRHVVESQPRHVPESQERHAAVPQQRHAAGSTSVRAWRESAARRNLASLAPSHPL